MLPNGCLLDDALKNTFCNIPCLWCRCPKKMSSICDRQPADTISAYKADQNGRLKLRCI